MIRDYKVTDLDQVMNIWQQAFALAHPFLEEVFVEKVTKDMKEVYLPNPEAKTWVYIENNEMLGFVSMLDCEIAGLFVSPKNHSKGIGTLLVNHVRERYDYLNVEVFENNKIGRAFYDKYGFKKVKEYLFDQVNQKVFVLRIDK